MAALGERNPTRWVKQVSHGIGDIAMMMDLQIFHHLMGSVQLLSTLTQLCNSSWGEFNYSLTPLQECCDKWKKNTKIIIKHYEMLWGHPNSGHYGSFIPFAHCQLLPCKYYWQENLDDLRWPKMTFLMVTCMNLHLGNKQRSRRTYFCEICHRFVLTKFLLTPAPLTCN